ncbi:outer membrane beta-barrel protein [Pedobacter steynii]|nr:outer membrane beta-barrel protein [Pedobacter steynii]NQX37654.1 outer membrane beta-barrel protein [Pedobacter steynii]
MNKKLIIAAALCGLALGSHAQTEKGNFLLGGSFSFTSQKKNEGQPRTNSFGAGPQFGYFIGNNFAIGLGLGYFYAKRKPFVEYTQYEGQSIRNAVDGYQSHGITISPFIRYYVPLGTKFKFFGAFSANVRDQRDKYIRENKNSNPNGATMKSYGLALAPGFAFFPTKKLAIEFSTNLFSYNRLKWSNYSRSASGQMVTNEFSNDQVYFGLTTIQPAIGLNYHF